MIDYILRQITGIPTSSSPIDDAIMILRTIQNTPTLIIDAINECTLYKKQNPFYKLFLYGTNIGEVGEEVLYLNIPNIVNKYVPKGEKFIPNCEYSEFNKNKKYKPTSYDLLCNNHRLEIKVIRAIEKSNNNRGDLLNSILLSQLDRALSYKDNDKISNQTFQQTKPDNFDYLVGLLIYLDQIDMYVIPATDFKNGTLKIGNQHAEAIKEDGTTDGGHAFLKDLSSYKVKSFNSFEDIQSITKFSNILNNIT